MAASTPSTNPTGHIKPSNRVPSWVRLPAFSVASSLILVAIAALPGATAVPISEAAGEIYSYAKAEPKPAEDPSLWLYLTTAALLVILGGVFAGLTIAYVDTLLYTRQSVTVQTTSLKCSLRVRSRTRLPSLARIHSINNITRETQLAYILQ